MSTGQKVRVGLLLTILALVALDTWLTRIRTTEWDAPLRLSIYPIVADGAASTRRYVQTLRREDFLALETFLAREADAYGVPNSTPLRVKLGPEIAQPPPLPPANRGIFSTAWWSLRMRWWANRMESGQPRPRSQVRIFVLYYDPATHHELAHSLGLKEGLIGIVHAFASRRMATTNNVVIAHELLHTLGASDKYHPETGLPRFPEGYAEPDRKPLHPQQTAEIMGGRIPLSDARAEIPLGLQETIVGPLTAQEIGWTGES